MGEQIIHLLKEIEENELVVPEFQREYVWSYDQAKEFIKSLYGKWPTGSFLFWNVKPKNAPPLKNKKASERGGTLNVLLDGQQRLTALYLLIKGEVPPYYSKDEITYDPRELYFNLYTAEFKYYKNSEMKENPLWQRVCGIYRMGDSDIQKIIEQIKEASIVSEDPSSTVLMNYQKLRQILECDYPILKVNVPATLVQVVDLFDKVNSQGTKLTKGELALAHMQTQWASARKEIKCLKKELASDGFDLNIDFFVRCIVGVITGGWRPETIHNTEKKKLIDAWSTIRDSLKYLIKILPREAFVDNLADLSTDKVLIPMAVYLSIHNKQFSLKEKKRFFHWMYLAILWGRYSSSPETSLDKDVRIVSENGDPFDKLVREIVAKSGRTKINASEDVRRKRINTGIGVLMRIAAKSSGAVDWFNGTPLSSRDGGSYHIEQHHVFPSSILYKTELGGYDSTISAHRDLVNEVSNNAFLVMKTNRTIGNTEPSRILPDVKHNYPGALEAQFVPINEELWTLKNYEKFLQKRSELIAAGINNLIER